MTPSAVHMHAPGAEGATAGRAGRICLLAILIFGIGVRFALLPGTLTRTPDERVYAHQASVVQAQGPTGFTTLAADLQRDPAATALYPSPLRAGWIALLAGASSWIGEDPMTAGSVLSFLSSAISLLLLAWVGLRFFNAVTACAATLLLAVFPFDLVIYQRAWQESFCSLLGLGTVAVVLYVAGSPGTKRWWWPGALWMAGLLAFTVKENCAVLFVMCGAGLALSFWMRGQRRDAVQVAAAMVCAAVASLIVLSVLFGGPAHYVALYRTFARFRPMNAYIAQYESGPAWMNLAGLWHASWVLCAAVAAGLVYRCILAWREREASSVVLAVAYAGVVFFVLALPATLALNFRFDAPAFAVLCLLAGTAFNDFVRLLQSWTGTQGRRLALGLCGLVWTLGAARDLHVAHEDFLQRQIPDLAVRMVLGLGPAPPADAPRAP